MPSFARIMKHHDYYIAGADVTFLAQNVLFKVHRYFFERESSYFKDVFKQHDEAAYGSESEPIMLDDVDSYDFAQFLWVIYNPKYSIYDTSCENWFRILSLAHEWRFPEIKELAIREIEKLPANAVDKIAAYHDCEVSEELLIPSYAELCMRSDFLNEEEANCIQMATVLKLVYVREHLWRCLLDGKIDEDIETVVRGIFNIRGPETVPDTRNRLSIISESEELSEEDSTKATSATTAATSIDAHLPLDDTKPGASSPVEQDPPDNYGDMEDSWDDLDPTITGIPVNNGIVNGRNESSGHTATDILIDDIASDEKAGCVPQEVNDNNANNLDDTSRRLATDFPAKDTAGYADSGGDFSQKVNDRVEQPVTVDNTDTTLREGTQTAAELSSENAGLSDENHAAISTNEQTVDTQVTVLEGNKTDSLPVDNEAESKIDDEPGNQVLNGTEHHPASNDAIEDKFQDGDRPINPEATATNASGADAAQTKFEADVNAQPSDTDTQVHVHVADEPSKPNEQATLLTDDIKADSVNAEQLRDLAHLHGNAPNEPAKLEEKPALSTDNECNSVSAEQAGDPISTPLAASSTSIPDDAPPNIPPPPPPPPLPDAPVAATVPPPPEVDDALKSNTEDVKDTADIGKPGKAPQSTADESQLLALNKTANGDVDTGSEALASQKPQPLDPVADQNQDIAVDEKLANGVNPNGKVEPESDAKLQPPPDAPDGKQQDMTANDTLAESGITSREGAESKELDTTQVSLEGNPDTTSSQSTVVDMMPNAESESVPPLPVVEESSKDTKEDAVKISTSEDKPEGEDDKVLEPEGTTTSTGHDPEPSPSLPPKNKSSETSDAEIQPSGSIEVKETDSTGTAVVVANEVAEADTESEATKLQPTDVAQPSGDSDADKGGEAESKVTPKDPGTNVDTEEESEEFYDSADHIDPTRNSTPIPPTQ